MENEKRRGRFLYWLTPIVLIMIFSIVLGLVLYPEYKKKKYFNKRVMFLMRYLPKADSVLLVKYSDKYRIYFIDSLAILFVESQGEKNAKSRQNKNGTRDYGYYQLNSQTVRILKRIIASDKSLQKIINVNSSVYDSNFNIWGGHLWLRTLMDYFEAEGWFHKDVIYYAVECYNMGLGRWVHGYEVRNIDYLKKWLIKRTYFEAEWQEFKKNN